MVICARREVVAKLKTLKWRSTFTNGTRILRKMEFNLQPEWLKIKQ